MRKLGFGLMRLPLKNPNDQSSIDIEEMKRMVETPPTHIMEERVR